MSTTNNLKQILKPTFTLMLMLMLMLMRMLREAPTKKYLSSFLRWGFPYADVDADADADV